MKNRFVSAALFSVLLVSPLFSAEKSKSKNREPRKESLSWGKRATNPLEFEKREIWFSSMFPWIVFFIQEPLLQFHRAGHVIEEAAEVARKKGNRLVIVSSTDSPHEDDVSAKRWQTVISLLLLDVYK